MSTPITRLYNWVDDKNNAIPITDSRQDAELDQIITSLNQKVIIKASAPSSPIAGMLWYDSTNKYLKQYRNSEWVIMGIVHISSSAMGTPQAGDLWFNTSTGVLGVYYGSAWVNIGTMSFPSGTAYGDMFYTNLTTTALVRIVMTSTPYALVNGGTSGTPLWGLIDTDRLSATAVTAAKASALFGNWVDKSGSYAAQQATTDCIICARGAGGLLAGYTDANTDPTTVRVSLNDVSNTSCVTFPVKKGDYWKVTISAGSVTSVYLLALGS